MEKYYTYLWLRDDGTPYYVGKGCGRRAYVEHAIGNCPSKDRVIIQYFECEEDALCAEKFLIAYYGRIDLGTGILRNYSDGGEGAPNISEETRRKKREFFKNREFSVETRAKISISLTGKIMPDNTRKKVAESKFQAIYKTGKSGRRGIAWDRSVSKWLVRARIDGKRKFIGLHTKLEDAIDCLERAQNATQKN